MEDVGAFRINEKPRYATGLAIIKTISLCHWTHRVGLATLGGRPGIDNEVALVFPEIDEFACVLADILHVQRRRKLGKPLAHPLIVITVPAYRVPPPLMSNFVRSHIAPEIICSTANTHELGSLGFVYESCIRHEDQCGPCLSKESSGLLRHRNAGKW